MADVKIRISDDELQQYKDLAVQWSPVFMRLPVATAKDVLRFFTPVNKLRGKRRMPSIYGKSQFKPFDKHKASDAAVDIEWRTLETHQGNVIETFAPVDYVDLPLGYNSKYLGEALKRAPQSVLIMAELMASRGQFIAQAAMTGKRNPKGDTTEDICDGLITIAKAEIEAGNISVDNGNLFVMDKVLDDANTCDQLKKFVFSMDPFLRKSENILFCAPDIVDKYNESYLLTHHDVPYNKDYEQPYVEGSSKKLTLVGLPQLEGTDIMFATQKKNLLYGTYLESDQNYVDIIREGHYEMSMCSDMWLGFNFRTLDKRLIKFISLKSASDAPVTPETPKESSQGDGQEGGQVDNQ